MAEEKKKFPIMMIVAAIVVGLILAGGLSYFIVTKLVADKNQDKNAHEPGIFVKLGDPKEGLVLNIGGVNSGHYLKISVILELKPDKKRQSGEGKSTSPEEIKALDAVVQLLRSQKVEDFEPGKQDKLKDAIKNEVNRVLGGDSVYEVYITNFVLQ
jgi:Flagellar basal body-associated protein